MQFWNKRRLKSCDSRVQLKAALALAKAGNNTGVLFYIDKLKNGDWPTRREAIQALGELKDRSVVVK